MSLEQKKYKICLVSECLSTGGTERVAAILSHFFVSKGIDIHHVTVIDSIVYDYSGKLFNLGKLKNKSNSIFNKIKRFAVFSHFIKENQFDFIIDFRVKNNFLQEWLVSKFIYKSPTIYTVHSFMVDLYFSKHKPLVRSTHKKAYGIVSITNAIKDILEEKYQLQNIKTIYNPIDFSLIESKKNESLDLDFEYIVCAGRMNDNVKQFDKLIEAYANSILPSKNIKLVVLGDGSLKKELESLVKVKELTDKILFLGHVENPFKWYKNAQFFVLSSLHEGLPMVILESLACGTPVVAFDCLSGPSEIIINNENGILVENQNLKKLTEAINLFVEDEKLYEHCRQNAKQSIQKFSLENIGKQWLEYLKINVS